MCTLCLSDMGELHDEWLRVPVTPREASASAADPGLAVTALRNAATPLPDDEAVAA